MKYFTYKLITAANDWIEQTDKERVRAEKRICQVRDDYGRALYEIKPLLSKPAWNFFWHGVNETGLHDARLLSFSIGDGLDYEPDGNLPFRLNHQRTVVRIGFLNYEQEFHHVFEMRGIKSTRLNLFPDEDTFIKSIGDLYTYEIMAGDEGHLQFGLLFATGAEIEVVFKRLIYRRHRIRRKYRLGLMYD
jgi:hypothetical protein